MATKDEEKGTGQNPNTERSSANRGRDECTPLLHEESVRTTNSSSTRFDHETANNDSTGPTTAAQRSWQRAFKRATSLSEVLDRFTRTERDKALQRRGVGAAAFLIRDAVIGEVENPAAGAYDPYKDASEILRNSVSIICRRVCAYRPMVTFFQACLWTLVVLTFIEPPHWCRSKSRVGDAFSPSSDCEAFMRMEGIPADNSTTTPVPYYPNSKSMLVTVDESMRIEGVVLVLLTLFIALRVARDGLTLGRYLRPGSARVNRIAQLGCLVLLYGGLISGHTIHHPYVRLILLATFAKGAQLNMQILIKVLPEVFNVLAVLFVLMGFYAWFGAVMFVDTDEGHDKMSSFIEALWSLWIMVTTANYPDVMMPAYNDNRWTGLYFVSFMIVSFFFLMNVILARVVNEYNSVIEEREKQHEKMTDDNLEKAFQLMDYEKWGRIGRDTVMALFAILNEDFPEFRSLTDDETKLLFAILDRDGSSSISKQEFMDFGNVLLLDFVHEDEYTSLLKTACPQVYHSNLYQTFAKAVKSDYFEYAIDAILVANAIVVAVQSYPELSGQDVHLDQKYYDGTVDTVWELMESIFTLIYVAEVLVKVLVFGWRAYSDNQRNLFDFTVTVMAVIASAIVYYPNEISDTRVIRMIVMIRVLRLVRVLTAVRRFQVIGMVSGMILPAAKDVVLLLFFLLYLYACLGMHLYGGQVTRDPSNPLAYLILDTEFSENNYWANNFNDMISSMNVLFNLLVVNNWNQCEAGFEATTQARWVRLYYFFFHVLAVILVNNLVIAFIINAFLSQLAIYRERVEHKNVGDGDVRIAERQAFFDASRITGTKTTLSGTYIARIRKTASNLNEGHEHERLKKMFTQTHSTSSTSDGSNDSSTAQQSAKYSNDENRHDGSISPKD